jgi:RNA polymerase sigma-70 factor (ECF subfamily)
MDNLREQFSQVYDKYIDKIYRFVYLKVDSQEIAEDITSKVFLKGWEAYSRKFEIRNERAFLYQIARNAVVDYYRERARTKIISSEVLSEMTDPTGSPHEKAILGADAIAVRLAIQKLEKEHQDIIIWHYLDDMPIADIAKILGRPVGTVRVMLHRGLKELKGLVTKS